MPLLRVRADLIIMGLPDSAYTRVISHLDLATTMTWFASFQSRTYS